jgi:hypothetical protein
MQRTKLACGIPEVRRERIELIKFRAIRVARRGCARGGGSVCGGWWHMHKKHAESRPASISGRTCKRLKIPCNATASLRCASGHCAKISF